MAAIPWSAPVRRSCLPGVDPVRQRRGCPDRDSAGDPDPDAGRGRVLALTLTLTVAHQSIGHAKQVRTRPRRPRTSSHNEYERRVHISARRRAFMCALDSSTHEGSVGCSDAGIQRAAATGFPSERDCGRQRHHVERTKHDLGSSRMWGRDCHVIARSSVPSYTWCFWPTERHGSGLGHRCSVECGGVW